MNRHGTRFLVSCGFAVVLLGGAAIRPLGAQVLAPNLIYTSVQPCRVFDTRFSTNGKLIAGAAQTFNVVGDNADPYFTGQGGKSGGCALPGFDITPAPQVQAVMLNFVAIAPSGAGDLRAWPSDQITAPNSSVINYAPVSGLNIANGIVVPLRQDAQGGDITVRADVSNTNVLADVVGYFSESSAVQASGIGNFFLGRAAGNQGISTGSFNLAIGYQALAGNQGGANNTALGNAALSFNMSGKANTAVGEEALNGITTGSSNVAIGQNAGFNYLSSETNNILVGNNGTAGESNHIRIGTTQTSVEIAGIYSDTTLSGSATAVLIDSGGRLGTGISSSLRFKEDVSDMGTASNALMNLRPVTFRYKAQYDDGSHLLQYGLIAEEVAKVFPNLVQLDTAGDPLSVRYHFLSPMLLNEVQKLHAKSEEQAARIVSQREELDKTIAAQAAQLGAQQTRIEKLEADLSELRALLAKPH